jgi:hypothetical protein
VAGAELLQRHLYFVYFGQAAAYVLRWYLPDLPGDPILQRWRSVMNWLGFFAVMALAAIILSVVTDVEITTCQSGSAYAMLRFCKPNTPATTTPSECRFRADCK